MIRQIRIIAAVALLVAGLLQAIFFGSWVGICCVLLVWAASFCVGAMTLQEKAFTTVPLSSLVVVSFCLSHLVIPLIGTVLDWKSITWNLKMPFTTFGYTALTVLTLALTQLFYRRIKNIHKWRLVFTTYAFRSVGMFKPPTTVQLWAMGAVGMLAMAASAFLFDRTKISQTNFLPQLVTGFIPFSYAPFLIPVARYFWPAKRASGFQMVAVLGYVLLLLILAMALNIRGALAIPLATLVGCVGLAMFTGQLKINLFRWRILIPVLLFFFVGGSVLSDFATALRVARLQRNTLSSGQMITRSIELFFDKDRLRSYWAGQNSGIRARDWDERYLDNEFLQRLSFLQYTDRSLYYTSQFADSDRKKLADFSRDRLYAALPGPLIRMMGIHFNKWRVLMMSFGDYVFYSRTGFDFTGYRTGSFIGTGTALYGWYFFPIFFCVALLVFFIIDSLSYRMPGRAAGGVEGWQNRVVIAPVALMFIFTFAMFFNGEALVSFFVALIRTLPQTLIIYLLLLYGTTPLNIFSRVSRN